VEHFDVNGLGVEIEVEMDWRKPPERGTRTHFRPNPGYIYFFAK
jgi:hypothetical protein